MMARGRRRARKRLARSIPWIAITVLAIAASAAAAANLGTEPTSTRGTAAAKLDSVSAGTKRDSVISAKVNATQSPTTSPTTSPTSSPPDDPTSEPSDDPEPDPPTEDSGSGWPSAAAKQAVIDNAGLSNPGAVPDEPEPGLTVTEDGAVIENRHLSALKVEAADVTIRNVKITYRGDVFAIRADHPDVDNLLIETVELDLGAEGGCTGIWHSNRQVTMRQVEISGYNCDALKPGGGGSLYEGIYIHDMRRVDSTIHLDGMQTQGAVGLTIRNSVIEMDHEQGANAAFIASYGSSDNASRDILLQEVWLSGGNYILYAGSKEGASQCHEVNLDRVAFSRYFRYGPIAANNRDHSDCGTHSQVIWEDTLEPIS